ncbi:hypothetical protein UFOVP707_37 [uncultured Caudovirales phage]|uniref:Uncharacterized protein n=1 Tax=uncultured Caudovirales phage TaxID=2100421 RepID=A0A6J5NNH3_9CAUD|nr:hypothetical protein UFOVP707_37 [uncultured Caudovirales phage]
MSTQTDTTATPNDDDFDAAFAEFAKGKGIDDEGGAAPASSSQADSEEQGGETPAAETAKTEARTLDGDGNVFEAEEAQAAASATTEPAPKPEAKADPKADDAAPALPRLEDLEALLPPEKASVYAPLLKTLQKDLQRLRSDEGRVTAYQTRYEELRRRSAELEAEVQRLKTAAPAPAPTTPKAAAPAADNAQTQQGLQDEMDELAREYPELSGPLNLRIKRMVERLLPPAAAPAAPAAAPATADKGTPAEDPELTALVDGYAALAQRHPDYLTAVKSEEFKAWLPKQPVAVQRLMDSVDAEDASFVLDQFKAAKRATQQVDAADKDGRNAALQKHVGVRGSPARVTPPADDFDAAFSYFARKQGIEDRTT